MDIQDFGALGELISSIVIVITLIMLVYEVRGSRKAALQSNGQERVRKQDAAFSSIVESPHLVAIWEKAENHLGRSYFDEQARAFGLETHEMRQLYTLFTRFFAN